MVRQLSESEGAGKSAEIEPIGVNGADEIGEVARPFDQVHQEVVLGMADQDLERENWRLDNPPEIDVAASRQMGLFVVGRLAARHGVRVRLRHTPSSGVSALVWLPEH
jgi:hypothetical protein